MAAFGSPVVPEENILAAVVFFDISGSSNLSQSSSPCSSSVRHDLKPFGTSCPSLLSNIRIRSRDIAPESSAALTACFKISGSTIRNLIFAALIACDSSYGWYEGFVPAKIPPAAMMPFARIE